MLLQLLISPFLMFSLSAFSDRKTVDLETRFKNLTAERDELKMNLIDFGKLKQGSLTTLALEVAV